MNILADQMSRTKILTTEWSLNREIVQTLFGFWGHPLIDLFASWDKLSEIVGDLHTNVSLAIVVQLI
jgi:hypothetical protein